MSQFIKLINTRVMPYNLVDDNLHLKIKYIVNNRDAYKSDVSGVIYGNIGSGMEVLPLGYFSTDEFGMCEFYYSTNDIPDRNINTARLWASGYLGNISMNSSVVRANFINRAEVDEFIIDAGTCIEDLSTFDRSTFTTYDGSRPTSYIIERPGL